MTKQIVLIATVFLFSNRILGQNTEGSKPLPMLPIEWIQRLADSCTLVDYTYLTLPITMALDNKKSIQQSLRHIGIGAFEQTKCRLFAKIFYQINGRVALVADAYFTVGCVYFVYNVDGVPMFSNPMSTEGVEFFNQIIARQEKKK